MLWLIYAFLSAIFAALVAIFGKLGLRSLDPTLATTIRGVLMAVFLLIASLALKKFQGFSINSLTNRDWWLIIASALAGALSWLFYFWALKAGVASKVAAIDRLSVVFVVILAVFFLNESFRLTTILGSILIALGAILITWV